MKSFKITQSITDRQDASLGIYFKDVSKQSMLSPEEEIKLTRKIKEGNNEAINELVKSNLRFVISVAKQYQNSGLALVDLIQEGNLGLIQAAKLFNPDKGFRFISYAVWWIRQSIMKAITDQCRTIRVPMNQVGYLNKINKASEKFEQLNERPPSLEELKEYVDIDSNKIATALYASAKTVSLNTSLNEKNTSCLLDILPDTNVDSIDNEIIKNDRITIINDILSKLSYRDSDILRMSFGIGIPSMLSEEIAKRFGVSKERIRQIQRKAINFIRKNYIRDLKELL